MGRKSETGGVKPQGDRIAVRFTHKGIDISPTLDLAPNEANLKHAKRLRVKILQEIRDGVFDINRHFPNYKFKDRVQASEDDPDNIRSRTFRVWGDVMIEVNEESLEHSTLTVYRNHLQSCWVSVWGDLLPHKISHEMVLRRFALLAKPRVDQETGETIKGLSRKTRNNILIPLRKVFNLACKSLNIPNPTDGVENLKLDGGDPDPFTEEELAKVFASIEKHEGPAWRDYYEFAAYAGLRTSEQIAVTWDKLDMINMKLTIDSAFVMGKAKKRTKTHKKRAVELNEVAIAVIMRQRPRTFLAGKQIFFNPNTNRPFRGDYDQSQLWMRILRRCGVRHRPPKELRDTSVTMALQAGCDPYWVATQHGHSLQTMMKDYADWIPGGDKGRNLKQFNKVVSAPQEPPVEANQEG